MCEKIRQKRSRDICINAGVAFDEKREADFYVFPEKFNGLNTFSKEEADFWEKETHNPIPLGGIVIKRNTAVTIQQKVDALIKKSIEYAFSNYPQLNDYIRSNAQEMSEEVMRKHIDLYVNNYSIQLGEPGKKAVLKLLEVFENLHQIKITKDEIFV